MGEPKDELLRIHNERWGGRNRAIDHWMRSNPERVERFTSFIESWLSIRNEVGPKPMAMQSLHEALLLDEELQFDVESLAALRTWIKEEYPDG